ncbi:hypothetical protein DPMN_137358 [Dreissena polymorpha]|uniref:Uncharacterized protein n=1 Tax=Dreissena polymorpha TaxID=45954 RepID=A0A9D4G2F7_DREPO|nr:hypothetical protein DPMN_137358 [Dreissena polymorpha]
MQHEYQPPKDWIITCDIFELLGGMDVRVLTATVELILKRSQGLGKNTKSLNNPLGKLGY